ncbi:MCE family protein [Nocardioides humilatus]|uniref:MCE family protein n=1 Tax=Nocardioides humilatus TaxID=2607660 RepID=A0A5B1L6Y3_9ACTN|nr:MlaD family protein [Nocardioides humilatus]KAA1416372.1 MCE family protein [Nocardioides humilatus]
MRASQSRTMRYGVITLVVMAIITAATFNLSKFPGFRGTTYYAEFSDASGIHKGNIVQVGGIQVGRVTDVFIDDKTKDRVVVKFEVDGGDVDFGPDSTASIEVLNLLGEKFLDLQPSAEGQLKSGGTLPLDQTEAAYDIVGVFSDLTTTTEKIDTNKLSEALDVVAGTMNDSAPEIAAAFDGIARLSRSVSQRDEQIQTLFESSQEVTKVLDRRSADIVDLMRNSDLVFKELRSRKEAVHRLLVNARTLAIELRGVATDNEAEIGPALNEVNELLGVLVDKRNELKATLHQVGPYVEILSNIIGTGPWFDALAINILGFPTGEFVPGTRP